MSDNTASNLGTGQGIFAQKVGDDLQFKGLVGGTNVTLTADANNITITASNDTTALNLGTGSGLFTSKSGDNLQLKSIIANAASGISVTSNTNDLTFQLVTANVDAGKLGGVAASDFLRKSDNLASVASVATARTNLDVYSKAEVDANTLKNNANQLPDTDSTYSLGSNSYKWLNIYADNFYGRASTAGSIDSITNIGDIDTSGAVNGSVLKYNSSNGNWEVGTDLSGGGGGGSATFVGLTDTPSNLTGDAGKFVRVNSGETALEFTSDVATQTYVDTQVANLVDSAPGTLDTLNELAAALGDDANFATTVTNSIATKLATADFNTTFDNRLATKSTTDLTEGTNLYYTDARVDTHLNQSNPTAGYVLSWNGSDYAWVAQSGGGAGDITSVVAGTGLTGGATSGDATLNVDVGTTAGKIVQLDGSGRLPAVDGSQLTGVSTTTTLAGLTDTTIGTAANGEVLFYNGSAWVDQALTTDNVSEGANLYYTNARADARIGAANISDLSNVHTAAPTDGQVLKWDNGNGRWAPANDTDTVYTSFNSDFDTRLASKDTGDVAEGSNLYFTNARADARVQAASLTDLSNVDAVAAGDDGKVLYYDHASTSFKWKVDAGGPADTDALAEGSTNLYFTNARATSAITGSNLNMGSNDITTTGKIYYANMFATEGDLPNATTYHGMFAHVHATGAGYFAHGGNWIKLANNSQLSNYQTTAGLNGAIDSHLNQSNPTSGFVLSWNGSDYAWVDNTGYTSFNTDFDNRLATKTTDNLSEGSSNLYYTDARFDTRLSAKNTGDLTEGSNLYFTNARADARFDTKLAAADTDALSEGSTNLYFTNARADARIGAANISDLANVHTAAPTDGQVLKWDNANSRWAPAADNDTVYSTFNSDFDTRLATKSTTNLAEGTNLYYTDARADARIAAATTDDLTEGSSNLYFTQARARASISEGSAQLSYDSGTGVLTFTQGNTDTVAEGSTNLYYTSARANADFDTRLATKDTGDLAEGTNLYYTNARADARIANNILDEDNFASNSATNTASQQSIKAYVDAQVASENELSEMNDVTISAVGNNHFIKYNASTSKWENASVAAASAAGNDTEVQFNDGGLMGSDPGMVYNKTTNDLTVSGKILYSNVYSAEGDLPSAATYHGMFAHVHGTGKGYFAHGGAWRKLLDETSSTTTDLTEGTNLYYTDARFDTRLASKDTGDLTEGSNLYYTDARARAAISEGSAQLSYNSSTGVLTFTQDDTDGIAEGSTNLYFTNARADARIAAASINALSDVDTSGASNGKILKYNGSTWVVADDTDTDTGILNVVEDTTPQLGGTLDANGNTIDMGTNVITDAKVGQWDTAYGWGDHGSAGYLTSVPAQSFASLTGKPTTIAGYGITDAFDNTDFDTRLATKDTDDVAEGSTNLYYTDARADTRATLRIGAANLSALNDVNNTSPTDGQVLTWDNANSYWKPAAASGGGTFGLAGNTGTHTFNTATETLTFLGTTGQINAGIAANNVTLELDPNINSIVSISFEGSTADNNETKLQATDPTADRTINLPDATGHLAVFATAPAAAITDGTAGQALVTDGNGALSFTTISGGSSLTVQDEGSALATAATTLNFVGAGVTASGTGATKTITIAGGGGSGGTEYEEFKINYSTSGQVASISDTSSGISSVNIDSAAGGDLTVNFTGYTTPPLTFVMYGYNYAANKYNYNSAALGNMTLRELPGGGSSGSPTAFGSFSNMQIRCSESETGASRSFGTTTHAWVRFVMGA